MGERNVSETKVRQEGLMVCLVSSISLVGCWLGSVEVRGSFLTQDVGELGVPRVLLR